MKIGAFRYGDKIYQVESEIISREPSPMCPLNRVNFKDFETGQYIVIMEGAATTEQLIEWFKEWKGREDEE